VSYDVKWDMDFDENAYLQPLVISEKESEGTAYWGLMQNAEAEGVLI
jgi:hypothetical protein